MLSLFFRSLTLSLLAQIEGDTPAAAVPPRLQLSDRMFWETLQHFAEGGSEAGYEGRAGKANSNPPDSLKSD